MKSLAAHENAFSTDPAPVAVQPDPASAVPPNGNLSVADLYHTILGRAPDADGAAFYNTQIQSGKSVVDVATQLVTSAEFAATYGTLGDAQFVGLMYQNMLHRAADLDGLNYWLNTVASESRGQSVIDFIVCANQHPADIAPLIGQPATGADPFLG